MARGEFDFGRVIRRTMQIVAENGPVLAGLGVVSAVVFLAVAYVQLSIIRGATAAATPIILNFGVALLTSVYNALLSAVVIQIVSARLAGSSLSVGAALKKAMSRAPALIALSIIIGLATIIGILLLFVPGILIMIIWLVAPAVLIVEGRGVRDSLARSNELTQGRRWAIFGLLVIVGVIVLVLSFATTFATGGMVAAATGEGNLLMISLASAIAAGIQSILSAAGVASIYYELADGKTGIARDQVAAVFD